MSDTPGPVDPDLMISDAELRSLADALRYGEPRQAVVARIEELIETNPRVATVEVSSTLEVSELAGRFVQFHRYAGSAASSSKDAPVWVRDDEVVVIEALASGSVVQLSCGARLDLQESAEAVLAALGHIEPEPLDEIGDDSQEHYT